MKSALALAIAMALVTPAFAIAPEEYWVVQDANTKHCSVVTEKPTASSTTAVGPMAFKSRSEAENSMKTNKACTSQ